MNTLAETTIRIAKDEIGQAETSANWSPRIAQYLGAVGWNQPAPWCAAFACWCALQASKELGIDHAMAFGLSTLKLWTRNAERRVTPGPGVDLSGCLGLRYDGNGSGHTVIVESMNPDGSIRTVSGNTFKDAASREGNCVAEHDLPLSQFDKGFGFIRIE